MDNDNEEDEGLFLLKVVATRLAQHELTDAAVAVPPTTSSMPAPAASPSATRADSSSRPTMATFHISEKQSGLTLDTEGGSSAEGSAGGGSSGAAEEEVTQNVNHPHNRTLLVSSCGYGTASTTTTAPGAYDIAGPACSTPGAQTLLRPSFLTANPHVGSSGLVMVDTSGSSLSSEIGEAPPVDTETAEEGTTPEDDIHQDKKIFPSFSKRQWILIACAVCAIFVIAIGLLVSFLPRDNGNQTPLKSSYELDLTSAPSPVSDYPEPTGSPVRDWQPTLKLSPTSNTTMVPTTSPTTSPLPECALNLDQNETGYVELRLQGVPTEVDGTLPDIVKEELEELFREVYKNVSGLCLDPYNRVLEQATLVESTTAALENDDQAASIVTTYWDARVTCNGCPSEEPLFLTGTSDTHRRRLREDVQLFDQSTEFLPLFASTLGYHLNELLRKQQLRPQQTVHSAVSEVMGVILATTKRRVHSDTESGFVSVMSVDKDTIEAYDAYVASVNGQVIVPFATDELRVLEACYMWLSDNNAVGGNRADTKETAVCQYLQDESLDLGGIGANDCFQNARAMELYCQDALGPVFDELASATKEGQDLHVITAGGSPSLDVIWEMSSDRTTAPTKTLLSYQGIPTGLAGTASTSPAMAASDPSSSPSQSLTSNIIGEERYTPGNSPSSTSNTPTSLSEPAASIDPTAALQAPTVSPVNPTLQPMVGPAPSLITLPTLDPTIFLTTLSIESISVELPTAKPTKKPIPQPTRVPNTPLPTQNPTPGPTVPPTLITPDPTPEPTLQSAPFPTRLPSTFPPTSNMPTTTPSDRISLHPTLHPSSAHSYDPSTSNFPSAMPSSQPSLEPSGKLSIQPTSVPSGSPSLSLIPSTTPSTQPSLRTSVTPSSQPIEEPSNTPSLSISPTEGPSSLPSSRPSQGPTLAPSDTPSALPSAMPSQGPTLAPSDTPSAIPSAMPRPSVTPSEDSSQAPTAQTCFSDNVDLYNAVRDDYSDMNGIIYQTYGPVESWCFDPSVDSFGTLFSFTTFNEDISGWDVAGVTNFGGTFEWTSDFNQDISGWDVSGSFEFAVSKVSLQAVAKSCSLWLTLLSVH